MNHLRNEVGNFRFEDFVSDEYGYDVIHISDSSSDSSSNSSDDSDRGMTLWTTSLMIRHLYSV